MSLCARQLSPQGCQQATGWTNWILLSSFSCLACDQKLGMNIWVPYKLDHLWIMSFGWQSLRPGVIVLKIVTLTSVMTSSPPAPSSLLWFLSLGSCSRTLQAELVVPLWLLSTCTTSMLALTTGLHRFVPRLLPVPHQKLLEDLVYFSLDFPYWTLVWHIIHLLQTPIE